MNSEQIKKIESTFRCSNSFDELFDTFRGALQIKLSDIDTYKILLSNQTLSPDEIKIFTEKLIKEFPQNAFTISLWAAKIFENYPNIREGLDEAIYYFARAINYKPTSHEPLLGLLNLYNYETDFYTNKKLFLLIDSSLPCANIKSKIYFALADHYKKIGDNNLAAEHLALGEKAAEREGDINSNTQ
jgi:hypothetical protein